VTPARRRIGWAFAALVILLGLIYPYFGPRLVAALTRDSDGCADVHDVPTESNEAETERATLCLLNARRAEAGLGPLKPSRTLARAARRHSADMGARRFFAHDTPNGTPPEERIGAAGYPRTGVTVGENLAWGEETAATPAEIVEGWMNSPGHRANILRPEFEEIGVGLAYEPPAPVRERAAVYTTNFGGRTD
jgi:uncharacterized protein YkwD